MTHCNWSFFWPPLYDVFHELYSWDVTSFSSLNVMHSGTIVINCMGLTLICMCLISSSLFSLWFCLDSKSAMNKSGPGLYMILTMLWCILNQIHWGFCDNVPTSFLNMVMSGLWSVIILSSLAKQWDWTCQRYTLCPVLLSQCCCISFLLQWVSCWKMWCVWRYCYLVLDLCDSSCCLWF